MPFINQGTVWLTAPALILGAMLLSGLASGVSLRRYLKA
ncbi:MAG: ABC transporter permease, partial [Bifidobacterium mongoliense]|nr:ABC transporter permease [Bifidobacterium mongoliense]